MSKEWCEHIFQGDDMSWRCRMRATDWWVIGEDWKMCPYCGTKRPKEKELTWDEIKYNCENEIPMLLYKIPAKYLTKSRRLHGIMKFEP